MSQLVKPHGSETLNIRLLEGAERESALAAASALPKITLSSRERGDLIMLGIGGFTPLDGFMGKADWQGVCDNMTLANGVFWPIPITLSTDQATADSLAEGEEVALVDGNGDIMGSMLVNEKYTIDKTHECQQVFKTTDEEHPGVKMVLAQGDVNLAGPVKVFSQGDFPEKYAGIYMTPTETRAMFEQRGWKSVAAFQTRNPMHRSHEHLAKIAIEICDGVMVHSLLGNLKPGDIPAEVRQEAISTLVEHYFVENTVVQSGYPLDMRYAGPREALLHALFRQNYGCSHLIVGRDHAGVGDYYGPFDAHHIFDEIPNDALITQPLKIDWTFWCDKCGTMASMRTCPHTADDRVLVSGTKLRKLLSEGGDVPDNFSRPEVLEVLRNYYQGLQEHEKVKVELKGHSAR
ncbi:sulfate adenylyltransferase [Alcanivorax venustensis ISO4]|uniref:Sulfate adenylyltransferase n=1 Tax=Alloalcanivorax venustensis ISO4 TaxID=1177184 RepID=A0ABS0AEM9_9GAMM|nr:sulfate adenylyltransferase [Alloalcanivorax venustensis]MBF5051951.1 sulfate adenylyltransferase [Alloalcanivorax venustensis ISO4]